MQHGNDRDPQVVLGTIVFEGDAAVLGPSFLADFKARHDFQAAGDGVAEAVHHGVDPGLAEHAVDAVANDQSVFVRLDVDVGRTFTDAFKQDGVDKTHHAGIAGGVVGVGQGRVATIDDHLVVFAKSFKSVAGHAVVATLERRNFVFGGDPEFHVAAMEADGFLGVEVGRVVDGDQGAAGFEGAKGALAPWAKTILRGSASRASRVGVVSCRSTTSIWKAAPRASARARPLAKPMRTIAAARDSPVRAVSSRTRSAWSVSSKPRWTVRSSSVTGPILWVSRSNHAFCVKEMPGFCRHPIQCRFAPLSGGRRPVLDPQTAAPTRLRTAHEFAMTTIEPTHVHEILKKHQLTDGMDIVLDLDQSTGPWVHDSRSGDKFLDCFTCYASWPLGYNHPGLNEASFEKELLKVAKANPSNCDLYSSHMASFVDAFATHVSPEGFDHHFWIAGGSLAVENCLKAAFDWKARKLGRTCFHDNVNDLTIVHFHHAFHGRSGYTLSVTNTLPDKVGFDAKFTGLASPAPPAVRLRQQHCNDV